MGSSRGRRDGRRAVAAAGVSIAACAALVACSGGEGPTLLRGAGERAVVPVAEAAGADHVVAATWRAGLAALATGEDERGAVVSPASLVVALAMLAEGASGPSVAALDGALGASGDDRTAAVAALVAQLARYEGDPALVRAKDLPATPMVHLATQVVLDDGVTASGPYLDRLESGYGAGVLVTDLASEAGVRRLDGWVRENTGGLVQRTAATPDPSLVLVLQDAIALAAAWQTPFVPAMTTDQAFTTGAGDRVQVPMMHGTVTARYAEVDGWRAVRLAYSGDGSSPGLWADVLLPPEASAAATDPTGADPAAVAAVVAALAAAGEGEVVVALPRLDVTMSLDLVPALERLGLGALLTPATAGLDGMLVDPPGPPYVGQATQQAVLRVDEAGTRAAAVTELSMMAGAAPAAPPHEIVLDRPYLLAIEDGSTGWPLFLASVLDPSAA